MNTMISVDTNVVVRFLIADDVGQFNRARKIFETEQVYIVTSVLLESEWVLRDRYAVPKPAVSSALRQLSTLKNVIVEDRSRVLRALDWAEAGMDFADALHLAGSIHCSAFASFDRKLTKVAARLGAPEVRTP